MYTDTHSCTHTHTHVHTHTLMYTHTHSCTQTHMHDLSIRTFIVSIPLLPPLSPLPRCRVCKEILSQAQHYVSRARKVDEEERELRERQEQEREAIKKKQLEQEVSKPEVDELEWSEQEVSRTGNCRIWWD